MLGCLFETPVVFLHLLCYVLFVYTSKGSNGETRGHLQGLVGEVDAVYYHVTGFHRQGVGVFRLVLQPDITKFGLRLFLIKIS